MVEFLESLDRNVITGMSQAAAAIALCLGVVVLCRRLGVHVEREAVLSLARGLVQMVAVGVVLALLLHGNLLIALLILLGMTVAAAVTASRRASGIKDPVLLSFYAIIAGSSVVIATLLATKTLTSNLVVLVPVGSMIIANAMNACAQAMERFKADVTAHVGQIEAGLALGADPATTVAPYVQTAVYASLLPRLDMLKSLGFVWIPGVMAGMLVSGASPV
jgi:UDP-glucose/iron transport system permease protein